MSENLPQKGSLGHNWNQLVAERQINTLIDLLAELERAVKEYNDSPKIMIVEFRDDNNDDRPKARIPRQTPNVR